MNQFRQLGINTESWYNYTGKQDFLVSKEVKVDNIPKYQEVLRERAITVFEQLQQIKDELTPRQLDPLIHILQGAKRKSISDMTNYEELTKQYNALSDRLSKIQEDVFSNQKQEFFGTLFEHMGHLKEAVELFQKERLTGTETKEQGFRVKLWDRDPAKDLFQGNYTHCCIAVGVKDAPQEEGLYTHDPATVAQFLADAGMQVAEIYDQEKKNPVANTWLFVSKDHNGEPVLVLDNVEVHNNYQDVHVNNMIRENLFEFVTNYAKACNIPKVGLGRVGTNDISWSDLPEIQVASVNKVGGYLTHYTSQSGHRAGRYYLEAYNAQTLGLIYSEENAETKLVTEHNKEQLATTGIVRTVDLVSGENNLAHNTEAGLLEMASSHNLSYEQIVEDLEHIEHTAFSEQTNLQQSIDEILETIYQPRSASQIFIEDGHLVGYLSSLPANQFNSPVHHNELDTSPDTLYVESIAGKTNGYQTLHKLIQDAKELGYTKINLHSINPRLNTILHRAGFETKAVIEEWPDQPAEYMEMAI